MSAMNGAGSFNLDQAEGPSENSEQLSEAEEIRQRRLRRFAA